MQHGKTHAGFGYYGYRFYDPNLQRWLNRDPLGEHGGINLFGFVGNSPIDSYDAFGKQDKRRKPRIGEPGYITPLPPERPPFDGCNETQKQWLKDAFKSACEKINSKCLEDCLKDPGLLQALREKCKNPDDTGFNCADSAVDPGCSKQGWNKELCTRCNTGQKDYALLRCQMRRSSRLHNSARAES
jgi:RHS repeat-associated protein